MNTRSMLHIGGALAPAALMMLSLSASGAHAQYGSPMMTPGPTGAAPASAANSYTQENLVSDVPGMAKLTDPNLKNPWGIVPFPGGPFWISDNGTGLSTLYEPDGQLAQATGAPVAMASDALVVTVPVPSGSAPAAATGIVFNGTPGFTLGPDQPSFFIFSTEDGTISGWNPNVAPTHAVVKVDNSAHASYKGLAIMGDQLFAANFRENSVDVFNSDFSPAGSFTDPAAPAGYAPFGIQNLDGTLYVTYAKQDADKHDDVSGAGNGQVDIFHPDTHSFTTLILGHGRNNSVLAPLNSPWGLAMAPDGFGAFSHDLLVGNFGDGTINAFDPRTGNFAGKLWQPNGQPIRIEGLWGLFFRNDPNNPNQPLLFFTAGIGGEQHGLFGDLRAAGG